MRIYIMLKISNFCIKHPLYTTSTIDVHVSKVSYKLKITQLIC